MFVEGQKVKIVRGENKGKRGIITLANDQWGWYNIRTNKGVELKVVPSNVIQSR
jgi:ribosomal protein L24